MCLGGIIHCSRVTDHLAQDGMLAESGFQQVTSLLSNKIT